MDITSVVKDFETLKFEAPYGCVVFTTDASQIRYILSDYTIVCRKTKKGFRFDKKEKCVLVKTNGLEKPKKINLSRRKAHDITNLITNNDFLYINFDTFKIRISRKGNRFEWINSEKVILLQREWDRMKVEDDSEIEFKF